MSDNDSDNARENFAAMLILLLSSLMVEECYLACSRPSLKHYFFLPCVALRTCARMTSGITQRRQYSLIKEICRKL